MRLAVVSDVHGNLTALDAVIADLRATSPDLVVHGGDLVGGGPRPAEVVDRLLDLGWPGVYGNTEDMLWRPHRVRDLLHAPPLHGVRDALLNHTIPATRAALGPARLAWLQTLPLRWSAADVSVVHAGPDDPWQDTTPLSGDELAAVFGVLGTAYVVFGHLHRPFIRAVAGVTVVNAGAVSQSHDGDPRAAYAVIDGPRVTIRRVVYDIDLEVQLLRQSDDPFAPSTAETLRTGRYVPMGAV